MKDYEKKPTMRFTAIRSCQAGRPMYLASVPFRTLARLFAIDAGEVLERSQRNVDAGRAKAIAAYLIENPESFVLPCLTATIDDARIYPEFIGGDGDMMNLGHLVLPMDTEIKLTDGQHRLAGIIQAIKLRPELGQHSLSVQFHVGMSLSARQQAFCDINSKAKKVSTSLNMAYNHRDQGNQLIVAMLDKIPAWRGKVDFERNQASIKTGKLFSFKHVVEACRLYTGSKRTDPMTQEKVERAGCYFSALSYHVGWEPANTTIKNSVACTAVGLHALARAGEQLARRKIDHHTAIQAMMDIDWSRTADYWLDVLVDAQGNMIADVDAQRKAANQIVEFVCQRLQAA